MAKFGICRGCGRSILWVTTKTKKSMPVDPVPEFFEPVKGARLKFVSPEGDVLSGEIAAPGSKTALPGYTAHWATCPEAGRFRRNEK